MKRTVILIISVISLLSCRYSYAQMVTRDEATLIANKYIRKAIDRYGDWGGDTTVTADAVMELKLKNGKLIGYYCNIEPDGFAVMSLRKEFSPVKACSDKGIFNPDEQGGLVGLIKSSLAAHINSVEEKFGPIEIATTQQVESVLEFSCRKAWNELVAYIPGSMTKALVLAGNYNEGDVLLSSAWDQNPPYNNECPNMYCTTTSNGLAKVGCVATAGAQIMRYWCWPAITFGNPTDPYEWWDMYNDVTETDPAAQQAAVAEICHDFGTQVSMLYGCDESSALSFNIAPVYHQNGYNPNCDLHHRYEFSASDWWMLLKTDINLNQPIQYNVFGHSIVCDGYRYDSYPNWEYHMNYGWGGTSTEWYAFDQLLYGNIAFESMVLGVAPNYVLGPTLSGSFLSGFHYVNMDASGSSAIFLGGSIIQSLPSMVVKGTGTTSAVKFYGTSAAYTRIYTNGDYTVGIDVANGAMILMNNGSFKLFQPTE